VLISLVSAKGAPGTSTSALALAVAWPRPVLLAECDPRGGDILWGFGQGRDAGGRGLLGLQVAARRQPMAAALWSQVIELEAEDTWALPGVEEPRHSGTVEWSSLARALASLKDVDVIADCGAVPAAKPPTALLSSSDLVTLVTRATLRSTHATQGVTGLLRSDLMNSGLGADRLVSIVVGPGHPYPLADVTAALSGTAPVLGSLPWDPTAAEVLSEGAPAGRKFPRSALMKGALELAAVLGGKALDFREEAGWAARADQHASQLRTLSGEQAVVSGVNGGGAR
jgi:hypothetical protein